MKELNEQYWSSKYEEGTTGWDLGESSRPLKEYIEQLDNKDLKILIPGCGNGYEARLLDALGFKNVYVADLSIHPLNELQAKSNIPTERLLHTNFFDLDEGFDLIIEQTFFCALDPSLRKKYVEKMYSLLTEQGKLVGLLFDFPLTNEGPPFGGSHEEYKALFFPRFQGSIERCYNSIAPRADREFFIKLRKKN